MSKAERTYKKFLGRDAVSEYEIELGDLKELAQIGKVYAIEYNAKKHSDKKIHTYRHKFKKAPVLLTNGEILIIVGNFEILREGISG